MTPSSSPENLARLSAALYELAAKVRADGVSDGLPFSHDAASLARARVWNLTSVAGEFDITFEPSGTAGYDDLAVNAIHLAVRGQDLPVADLADIIRSKEAAGRPKDFSALPALQRRLAAQADIPRAQRVAKMIEAAEARAGASPVPDRPRPDRRRS